LVALVHPPKTFARALPRAEHRDVLAGDAHDASRRRDLAGDDVDERGLPRSVGADHGASLARRDGDAHPVQRAHAAEGADKIADLDQRRTLAHAASPPPTMPCRASSTKATKTRPSTVSATGIADERTRSMYMTTAAPSTGPKRRDERPEERYDADDNEDESVQAADRGQVQTCGRRLGDPGGAVRADDDRGPPERGSDQDRGEAEGEHEKEAAPRSNHEQAD